MSSLPFSFDKYANAVSSNDEVDTSNKAPNSVYLLGGHRRTLISTAVFAKQVIKVQRKMDQVGDNNETPFLPALIRSKQLPRRSG
jgi:hypothetical protein